MRYNLIIGQFRKLCTKQSNPRGCHCNHGLTIGEFCREGLLNEKITDEEKNSGI